MEKYQIKDIKQNNCLTQHIRCGLSALALRDIAPFGRNVVYAGNVIVHVPNNCRLFG